MEVGRIKELYERLKKLPVSELAKQDVGSFMLYDTLLAGCANRAADGETVDISKAPVPSRELFGQIIALRQKSNLTADERAYLEHFDLLEEIRSALLSQK